MPNYAAGFILIPVAVAIALIGVLAFLTANQSAIEAHRTGTEFDATRAELLAQAGLQHGLQALADQGCGPFTDLANVAFGSDQYSTTLTTTLGATTAYTVDVDQDGWIRDDNTSKTHPTDSKLSFRSDGKTYRPVYRYDLSTIPANTPVISAVAYFYVSKEHPEGPIDIHPLRTDWTEADANWDLLGDAMDMAVQATIPAQPTSGVWVSVNLTPLVQAWVNGQANLGITLNSRGDGAHGDYASREAGSTAPYLEIVTGIPPSPVTQLKAVGTLANDVSRTLLRREVSLQQAPPSYVYWQHDADLGVDAYIWEWRPTTNFGSDDEVWVASSNNNASRSLFKFAIESLPRGANIIDATLSLEHESGNDPDVPITAHRITRSWEEDEVTWRQRESGRGWGTDGADFDAGVFATTWVGPTSGVRYDWNLTDLVQDWVDGTYENHGVILATAQDGIFGERFYSSDETIVTRRPRLTITYSCACGEACSRLHGSGRIAFIGDDPSPNLEDEYKIPLLQSWGYEVDFYEDLDADTINWTDYDLAYVSETVVSSDFRGDPASIPIGVVNEEPNLFDEFLLAPNETEYIGDTIDIVDTNHFITSIFPPGQLQIYRAGMEIVTADRPLADGLQTLGEFNGAASLTAIEAGALTTSGTIAAARRVTLPLGQHVAADFNWTQLNHNAHLLIYRAIEWARGGDRLSAPHTLLMVVVDPSNLTVQEAARKVLIESWDYEVNVIGESEPQGAFDAAIATSDVVFITEEVSSSAVDTKLLDAAIGVVNEEGNLADEFGISGGYTWGEGTELVIENNANYITQPFEMGALTILTSSEQLLDLTPGYAPDLEILGRNVGDISLVALDTGESLLGGGTAAGRRVMLPWGGSGMDINSLNDDGLTIFRRALDWARGENLTGPIAHWKLDETSGLTAVDSVGGHDGALGNGPGWGTGQLNGGLDFDGLDDTVDAGSADTIDDLFAGGGTLTAWIRPRGWGGGNFGRIADKADALGTNRNGWAFDVYGSPRALLFQYGFSGEIGNWHTQTDSIALDTWQHVAVVYDNSIDTNDPVIYVDGEAQTLTELNTPSGVPSSDAASNFTIGNYATDLSRAFDGVLDDVRIYDRMLSTGEIAELATLPPKLPVAHWKLDENSGLTAVDSAGGHDGTLVNGPSWTAGQIGGALDLDGSDDHITVPHDPKLSLSSEFTITTWFRADTFGAPSDPYRTFVGKYPGTTTANYWFGTWQQELVFGFWSGGTFHVVETSGLGLQPGRWYHAAVMFTDAGGAAMLFVDGVDVSTGNFNASPPLNTGDVVIGQTVTGDHWDGQLDDIRIYDQLLTQEEIAALASSVGGGGGNIGNSCDGTYRDDFNTRGWNGSNGSLNWSDSPWIEVGEGDGATSGDVQVRNDQSNYQLRIRDNDNGGEGVVREADLTGATSATLSFNYRRAGLDNSGDYVAVYASSSGAAGPWTELPAPRIEGGGTDSNYQTYTRDISGFISANTAIRLRSSSSMGGQDTVWFDNIQIQCSP